MISSIFQTQAPKNRIFQIFWKFPKTVEKIFLVFWKPINYKKINSKKIEAQYTESDMKVLEILPIEIETMNGSLWKF